MYNMQTSMRLGGGRVDGRYCKPLAFGYTTRKRVKDSIRSKDSKRDSTCLGHKRKLNLYLGFTNHTTICYDFEHRKLSFNKQNTAFNWQNQLRKYTISWNGRCVNFGANSQYFCKYQFQKSYPTNFDGRFLLFGVCLTRNEAIV